MYIYIFMRYLFIYLYILFYNSKLDDVPAAITALASSMSVLFIIAVFSIVVNIVLTLLLFKTKSRQSQV